MRLKLPKYRENNKTICDTLDHNFENVSGYVLNELLSERYYFVLYDEWPHLKTFKKYGYCVFTYV